MCRTVWIEGLAWNDDPEVVTQGQLADLIGGSELIVFQGIGESYKQDLCLCPVDVPATMKGAGYTIRDGWDDFGTDYAAKITEGVTHGDDAGATD